MTPLLDLYLITNNEEELVSHCLDSYCSLVDIVQKCVILDNNSTDDTLDIVNSYKTKLPITLLHHRENSHHGIMRTKCLAECKAPWIFYLDSDETFTSDFYNWLSGNDLNQWDWVRFFKYTTIVDKNHFVPGGNGYTQRLFRNYDGVHFPQSIHTEPEAQWNKRYDVPEDRVLLFDHTAVKSVESLWAKGWRYQWSAREQVVGIGPSWEYSFRVNNAYKLNLIEEFSQNVKDRITWGPDSSFSNPPTQAPSIGDMSNYVEGSPYGV